ncbi:MAG: RNA polymerase sigma factor [Solirubrobacteraceae bacterium]
MECSTRAFARYSDTELIRAACSDPAAFEALFERHAMVLRQWLLAQTRDMAVAEDLLAETFAQAWCSLRRFRGEDERSGGAWLYAIARHLLYRHYRHGRAETAARRRLGMSTLASCDGGIDDLPDRLDSAELGDAVREAFAALGPDQRRAIDCRVLEELSFEDVAAHAGCTSMTARTRVFRGLAALRAAIESRGSA